MSLTCCWHSPRWDVLLFTAVTAQRSIENKMNKTVAKKITADARKVTIAGEPHPCYLHAPDIRHKALIDFLNTLNN